MIHILSSERISFISTRWEILIASTSTILPTISWGLIKVHIIILAHHMMVLERCKSSKSIYLRHLTLFLRFHLYILIWCYYIYRYVFIMIFLLHIHRWLLLIHLLLI